MYTVSEIISFFSVSVFVFPRRRLLMVVEALLLEGKHNSEAKSPCHTFKESKW